MPAENRGRILVVHGAPVGAAAVQRLRLERAGFVVITVASPDEAVQHLRQGAFDLVLVNERLGEGIDGLHFCQELKAAGVDRPVILLIGNNNEATLIQALRFGDRETEAVEQVLQQVRTAHRLAESEARLASIIHSAKDAILVAGTDQRITLFNPAAEQMFRCPAVEAIGKSLSRFIPRQYSAAPCPSGEMADASSESLSLTHFIRSGTVGVRRDGEQFPLEASLSRCEVAGQRCYTVVVRDISDRHRAEQALRDSEERFRLVARATRDVVWDWDLRTNALWWNEAVQSLLGYTGEEVGCDVSWWYDRIHPDERQRVIGRILEVVGGTEAFWSDEYRFRRADGSYAHFFDRGHVLRDESGRPIRMIGSRVDVTERKRIEAERRHAQQFLQTVLDNIDAGVVACDADGQLTLFNRVARDWHGKGSEQVPPEAWPERFNLFRPDGRTPLQADEVPLYRVLQGEVVRNVEVMIVPPGGSPRVVLVNGHPVNSADGRLKAAVVTAQDVTARRDAEQRIREQAALLEKAHDAVLIRDRDDIIVFWNRGAERLYGWTAEEAIGKNADDLLYDDEPSLLLDVTRHMVVEQGEWFGELQKVDRNGNKVFVMSSWTLLRDDAGQPLSTLVIETDVTERKKLEGQLLQAQRMEAIGTLAGGVAHDFNNLLTVIIGSGEVVAAGLAVDDPRRGLVTEMLKAGERAAALTRQLLAFSRKQILAPRLLDLNDLVRETKQLLCRLIGEDVVLTTSLGPDLGRVQADPTQLEQVLMNLVVNARDAMPTGGCITLETCNFDLDRSCTQIHAGLTPGSYVMLAVSDTGTGMDEATMAQIFQPFFTTKEAGKGTGLGLATVHGVVKQSGGHIEVYSELGHGTVFKVYLPRLDERAAVLGTVPLPPVRRGTETVLLAEDEEGVRSLVRIALESHGYTVLMAQDGEEAIQISEQHPGPIHLLVTDVVMPKMSGRQLADCLTQRLPGLRILYVSGYTQDAIVRHGVLHSSVAFLQKPFAPTTLARTVREILDQ
jgi:PAS domain S-box-containing protein